MRHNGICKTKDKKKTIKASKGKRQITLNTAKVTDFSKATMETEASRMVF